MTDHEKRIREALEAGPTEREWLIDHRDPRFVYALNVEGYNQFWAHVQGPRTRTFELEANARLIAACNPADLRALLADLDAVRVKAARYDYLSERLVGADFDWNESGMQVLAFEVEPGTQVWATADKTIDGAIAALKGATHD